MTMQTIFEENKERLMSALSGADAPSAIRALNSELDRQYARPGHVPHRSRPAPPSGQ